ncbi:hypothetical protein ACER0A_012055 [Haloimpatiens sp. FM7315]|uniref:hypothetical protein n=1 Tax=Haloimpatiens sp. FM7315 TaxID=3298609 RepID=UPI00370ABD11
MKKVKISKFFILIIILIVLVKVFFSITKDVGIQQKIHDYLIERTNRQRAFVGAISLNNNSSTNSCVYFVSEVLRENHIDTPKNIANTSQLIKFLKDRGWRKDRNLENLKPGDLVFTTDDFENKEGVPTHVYVFMKWVKDGNYDYAYICDNQAKDYNNKIYHIRNVKVREKVKGLVKDEFSFFMKP